MSKYFSVSNGVDTPIDNRGYPKTRHRVGRGTDTGSELERPALPVEVGERCSDTVCQPILSSLANDGSVAF